MTLFKNSIVTFIVLKTACAKPCANLAPACADTVFYDTGKFRPDFFRVDGRSASKNPPDLAPTLRQPCAVLAPKSADFYRKPIGKAAPYRIPIEGVFAKGQVDLRG